MNPRTKKIFGVAAVLLVVSCTALILVMSRSDALSVETTPPVQTIFKDARKVGKISDHRLPEVSGLVASARNPGVLWVHNDSDDGPYLVALNASGKIIGAGNVAGAVNRDWEDISRVTINDTSFLVISETGDNLGRYKTSCLYFVPEPDVSLDGYTTLSTAVARKVRFRYEDGPHDVEAMAVDPVGCEAILIAKRMNPASVYQLDLTSGDTAVRTARLVGVVSGVVGASPEEARKDPLKVIFGAQATAADISPDGHRFFLLTYRRGYLYTRADGMTWAQALASPPSLVEFGNLRQAEAAAFTPDGKEIRVTSEKKPSSIIAVKVQE